MSISDWFKRVDLALRPPHVFEGIGVNLYPLTARGLDWLEQNKDQFSDSVWSRNDRCLELSNADSSHLGLTLIVSKLEDDRLKVRFYGHLKGWTRDRPWVAR